MKRSDMALADARAAISPASQHGLVAGQPALLEPHAAVEAAQGAGAMPVLTQPQAANQPQRPE